MAIDGEGFSKEIGGVGGGVWGRVEGKGSDFRSLLLRSLS